jgi:serine/threonine protein phosphatase PrpC
MTLSHATAQGSRSEQQDRLVIAAVAGGQLLAVMDGHGGSAVAEKLARNLAGVFGAYSQQSKGMEGVLAQTIKALAQETDREPSGSTLSVAFIPSSQALAYVAILGDSPVVIKDPDGSFYISPMHNARSNARERQAAIQRGARYSQGYLEDPESPRHALQMSRSLGDSALSRILDRQPDIYSVELGDESFILLATDGLLDSHDISVETQLKRSAGLVDGGWDAQRLVDDALERQTGDNVTVIIWRT